MSPELSGTESQKQLVDKPMERKLTVPLSCFHSAAAPTVKHVKSAQFAKDCF